MTYTNVTRKINVNGIVIEYDGEDTGVGALFASKAAVQLLIGPLAGGVIDRVGTISGNPQIPYQRLSPLILSFNRVRPPHDVRPPRHVLLHPPLRLRLQLRRPFLRQVCSF